MFERDHEVPDEVPVAQLLQEPGTGTGIQSDGT
jgi:hypothetical protein